MPKVGWKHSAESRAKMRRPHILTPETRAALSAAAKSRGRKPSAAAFAALRKPDVQGRRLAALRAAFKNPEVKARRSAATAARMRTTQAREAARAAISSRHAFTSKGKREWWAALTPEQRAEFTAKRGAGQKRRWAALTIDERRTKMARIRQKAIQVSKLKWASMDGDQKAAALGPVWRASQIANPSSIETIVASLLDAMSVAYDRQVRIGQFVADFVLVDRKLVIECDGDYWHSLPGRRDKDARRDERLKALGYSVIRIPEHVIKSDRIVDTLAKAVA